MKYLVRSFREGGVISGGGFRLVVDGPTRGDGGGKGEGGRDVVPPRLGNHADGGVCWGKRGGWVGEKEEAV